ncbi:MAG: aminotransferase class I/II-fold pyridoxal phosphate-dependent enzyme [Lachnospiraceae bacterium]|nr:aminotransferase class I/II-fold pyridoxal phosphate-dependent enzyme [Lachnospiraceae bacterium]
MTYDFTTSIPREGKDALAVEGLGWGFGPTAPKEGFDFIPMWVADMNFPTAPSITRKIVERAEHPLYGYFLARPEYYQAIFDWQKRHGVSGLEKWQIGYHNGVLGGVASLMKAFTAPGDRVLMHSPAYIGFSHVLEDLGRRAELSPMKKDADGVWRMDFEDMERRLAENPIHFAIFCSPHNPTGRVWERREIERAMELYAKYDCIVAADEIWSDLILPGHVHIPTQSVSDDARRRTVAFYSPSKGFNLSGLWNSYSIAYDRTLQDRMVKEDEMTHYNSLNVLSMHALTGAYSEEGAEWLRQLLDVLQGNIDLVCDFVRDELPGVTVSRPQSTYLVFLSCDGYAARTGRSMDDIISAAWDVGVGLQDGRPFFEPFGLRLNLALPRSRVQEAMRRLKEYVFV